MKTDCIIDYASYILFRALSVFIRAIPIDWGLFLGRRLGDFLYVCDPKHKAIAYANIRRALGDKVSFAETRRINRAFYRSFGQNLIEMFFIPLIDKKYLEKYIVIRGREYIDRAFAEGRGVIFLGVHEGSWELGNIISANLGLKFSLFVRDQARFKRIEQLLNSYRQQKGCRIVQRRFQTRELVELLKRNEAVGMSIDQGGRRGVLVNFFNRPASMSAGAVKLALKRKAVILPVFLRRLGGPYINVAVETPFMVRETGDFKKDVKENLQRIINIFEGYIAKYPQEYLWSYKIWKYSNKKKILILSDGKIGHLKQARAVADIAASGFDKRGLEAEIDILQLGFKSRLRERALKLSACISGKYNCQGCLWCLKSFLTEDSYNELLKAAPDVIISCGSSAAAVNYVFSRQVLAKSIVIMRPSLLNTKRFDLVILPSHDSLLKGKNVLIVESAPNLISDKYLADSAGSIKKEIKQDLKKLVIGVLIGGSAKGFRLERGVVLQLIRELKAVSDELDADILFTTSRRTPKEVEQLIKDNLRDYQRCKLLVIANDKNISDAVGGILGLAQIVVVSPESISMISEAAASKKYVLVFESGGLSRKHQRFLKRFAGKRYIYLTPAFGIGGKIEDLLKSKPAAQVIKDNLLIAEGLKRIL